MLKHHKQQQQVPQPFHLPILFLYWLFYFCFHLFPDNIYWILLCSIFIPLYSAPYSLLLFFLFCISLHLLCLRNGPRFIHIWGFPLMAIFSQQETSQKSSVYSHRVVSGRDEATYTVTLSHARHPEAGLYWDLLCLYISMHLCACFNRSSFLCVFSLFSA